MQHEKINESRFGSWGVEVYVCCIQLFLRPMVIENSPLEKNIFLNKFNLELLAYIPCSYFRVVVQLFERVFYIEREVFFDHLFDCFHRFLSHLFL